MKRKRGRAAGIKMTSTGWIEPLSMRGPNDPTEYEVAVKSLAPEALRRWVRSNYRTKYVPEDVLKTEGLEDRWLEP